MGRTKVKRGAARTAPVTISDLADRCGLARGTVSMALRDDPRIAVATRARVAAAARDLGYDPTVYHAARRFSINRRGGRVHNHVVGLVTAADSLEVPYFRRMIAAAFKPLADAGYAMLMVDARYEDPDTAMAPEGRLTVLIRGEVDGLLSLGHPSSLDRVARLRERQGFGDRPMVSLIQPLPGGSSVVVEEVAGLEQAVRALLDHGHRQLLRLCEGHAAIRPRAVDRPERRAVVDRVLREAGLAPASHCRTLWVPLAWMNPRLAPARLRAATNDAEEQRLVDYLRANPGITAIMTNNDALALHAAAALRRGGIPVPGPISIIGHDDTDPLPGPKGENLLSSIALPLEDIGRAAAEALLRQIADPGAPHETITLPSRFVPRATLTRRA